MRSLAILAVLLSTVGYIQARVGMGPCPTTYPKVQTPFAMGGDMEDGRYFAWQGDALFLWAYQKFIGAFDSSERLDCWSAVMTKTATGFHWDPDYELNSLKYCRKDVKCDPVTSTCNCYVTAKPWEVVYFDPESDTGIGYMCADMKYALATAMKNLGNPPFISDLINWVGENVNNFHASGMGIITKNPGALTSTQLTRLNNFINSFPDQEPDYDPLPTDQFIASLFGYNYKTTYSTKDLAFIDQSESKCKWSTKLL
jgi:hypothetical protein